MTDRALGKIVLDLQIDNEEKSSEITRLKKTIVLWEKQFKDWQNFLNEILPVAGIDPRPNWTLGDYKFALRAIVAAAKGKNQH